MNGSEFYIAMVTVIIVLSIIGYWKDGGDDGDE